MAQRQLRRSSRLANQRQSQIVPNNGLIAIGRAPNQNALPIAHGPPWTLPELKKKHVQALRSMVNAYHIVEGHKWKKADLVKALYDYGRAVQQAAGVEEEEPANDVDPGMTKFVFTFSAFSQR